MSKEQIMQIISAAVAAVDPYACTREALVRNQNTLKIGGQTLDLSKGRVFVVSIGKAAVPMAQAVADLLGGQLEAGIAITKQGQTASVDHPAIQTVFSAHPVPDERSVEAADLALELLGQTAVDDQVIFLISGGASALCTKPLIPLAEWQALFQMLLASGCTIQEANTVRKQLDRIKGGGLGQLAAPAEIVTLILSDVLGNPIDMIGSGPTVPNPQTPADALAVLDRYEIDHENVREGLTAVNGEAVSFESPIAIVGDLQVAAEAAQQAAEKTALLAGLLHLLLQGVLLLGGQYVASPLVGCFDDALRFLADPLQGFTVASAKKSKARRRAAS